MMRLLQVLFLGHWHKWTTINEGPLNLTDDGKVVSRGMRYIQQCEKCGIVVKRDLVGF